MLNEKLSAAARRFADACINMNSEDELEFALTTQPDSTDMAEWGLSEDEWKDAIAAAIAEMKEGKRV